MKTDWLYGQRAVESLLVHAPERVVEVWISTPEPPSWLGQHPEIAVQTVQRGTLDKRFPDQTHQGVAARYRPREPVGLEAVDELDIRSDTMVLVLDNLEDPRNLGACLRSAEAAGVDLVVLPSRRSAPLTAVAHKTAAGAAEILSIATVANIAQALERLKEKGVWCVGADAESEQTHYEFGFDAPTAVVLGAEGRGLRRLVAERCDALVSIPMRGATASLNVSVACGIMLFEARRQHACSAALHGKGEK